MVLTYIIYCRGLTRATCILCIEHPRLLRLSRESNPGPRHCSRTLHSMHAKSHSSGVRSLCLYYYNIYISFYRIIKQEFSSVNCFSLSHYSCYLFRSMFCHVLPYTCVLSPPPRSGGVLSRRVLRREENR
jgi:hypothetical protein